MFRTKPLIVRRSALAESRIISASSSVQRTRSAVCFRVLSVDMAWDSTTRCEKPSR